MKKNMTNDPQPWKHTNSEVSLHTPWFEIEKQTLITPSGVESTFYIHDSLDSVMCVCVTDKNTVLIERQWRPAVKKISVDYPAGKLEESDRNIEDAMLRELKEETGYQTTSFRKIAVLDKDPSFSKAQMHIYLAQGIIPGIASPEDTEDIHISLVSSDKILEMIQSGEMNCTFCVSATFFAFQELRLIKT